MRKHKNIRVYHVKIACGDATTLFTHIPSIKEANDWTVSIEYKNILSSFD